MLGVEGMHVREANVADAERYGAPQARGRIQLGQALLQHRYCRRAALTRMRPMPISTGLPEMASTGCAGST